MWSVGFLEEWVGYVIVCWLEGGIGCVVSQVDGVGRLCGQSDCLMGEFAV